MPMPTTTEQAEFHFAVPLGEVKLAASGDPDAKGAWTMQGRCAVYNHRSHDLGGFRTVIRSGAFDGVLATEPDVHLVLNHDMRYVLARTRSKTLELRADDHGMRMWARVAPTSYGNDLRILLERGDVDQMSFACDIGDDDWVDEGGETIRYINEFSALYDATVCPRGAFPQTNAQLVASVHDASALLASAQEAGRVIRREQDPDLVAARGENGDGIAQPEVEGEGAADVAAYQARRAALQERADALAAQHAA